MSKTPATAVLDAASARVPWMLDELRALVEVESPSGDRAAIDAIGRHLTDRLEARGARVERIPGGSEGDHLRAEVGAGDGQVLVLSHMDTVWPIGTAAARPFRIDGDRAVGPGTADMKGGIIVALAAIDLLAEAGVSPGHRIVWLLTSDEETGSRSSRPHIEAEARRSGRVLVTEPGHPDGGAVKTRRKGTGSFDIAVRGVASHAGAAHADGASAISELARQVARLDAMTDYAKGVTVNVGAIGGGHARNVVADHAWAKVDLRIERVEDADRIDATIRALQPLDPRVTIEVTGGISRPPMARPPCVAEVHDLARCLAADLGFALPDVASGGASDANFTALLGVPTLDGLGAVGDGMHGVDEYISIPHLAQRAALMALLLRAPLNANLEVVA